MASPAPRWTNPVREFVLMETWGPFTSWINDMPPKKSTQNIIWFKNCSSKDFPQVGGKNANLGELFKLGLRVPPGFAVTTHALYTFIDRGRVRNKIVRTLSQIPPEN